MNNYKYNRNNKNDLSPFKSKKDKEKSSLFCCFSAKKKKVISKVGKGNNSPIRIDSISINNNIREKDESLISNNKNINDRKCENDDKQSGKTNIGVLNENKEEIEKGKKQDMKNNINQVFKDENKEIIKSSHRRNNSFDVKSKGSFHVNNKNNVMSVNKIVEEDKKNLSKEKETERYKDFKIVITKEKLSKDSLEGNQRHTLNFERKETLSKAQTYKEGKHTVRNDLPIKDLVLYNNSNASLINKIPNDYTQNILNELTKNKNEVNKKGVDNNIDINYYKDNKSDNKKIDNINNDLKNDINNNNINNDFSNDIHNDLNNNINNDMVNEINNEIDINDIITNIPEENKSAAVLYKESKFEDITKRISNISSPVKNNLHGNLNSPVSLNKQIQNFKNNENKLNIENQNENEKSPKLNYINDNEDILKNDQILIEEVKVEQTPNQSITKNENNTENIDEDIDEDLGIDDEHNEKDIKLHDTRSIISSYVISMPKMPNLISDSISYAPSLVSKADSQSNLFRINSNQKISIIPPNVIDDNEVEITNENGEGFKAFIETPRSSNFNFKKDYSRENSQFKGIYEKIDKKEKEIKRLNEKINQLSSKIQSFHEENKKYEKWIEKEENEGELLRHMLNFLTKNK